MMKKSVLAGMMAAVMAAGLVACGSKEETVIGGADEATNTVVTEAADADDTAAEEAVAEAATEEIDPEFSQDAETAATEAEVEVAIDGFLLDASMHNLTVLTTDGEVITYVSDDLASLVDGGLEVAHNYEITTDGEEILAITCTDNVMMSKDYDALEIAAQVVLAVNNKDISYLSGLCSYPLTVDGDMVYETADDLSGASFDSIVSDDLFNAVLGSNLYYADMEGDTFSISKEGAAPEIVIGKGADGTWSVTAINN